MGTASVIKDLRTFSVAVNAAFKRALQGNSGDQSAAWTTVVPVSTKETEFPIAGSTAPMRVWEGSRIVRSVKRNAYKIKTQKFESTLSLSVEDEEDDNLDVYMPSIETMAIQTGNWKSQRVHKALEANGIGYDDQPFFSATHPEMGANVSNVQTGASPAWYVFDTSKPLKPMLFAQYKAPVIKAKTSDQDDNVFWKDEYVWGARARGEAGYGLWQMAYKSKAALDGPNFEDAVEAMRSRKDEYGESLDIIPNLLVVPPQLEWDARRLFGPQVVEATTNIYQGAIQVLVSNRLTGV